MNVLCAEGRRLSYRFKILGLLIALAILPAEAALAQYKAPSDLVEITAAPSIDKLPAGSAFKVAVILKIKPGIHINAATPDALYPTEMKISGGPGITFKAPIFPPAVKKKFTFSETKIPVYEGKQVIVVPGRVAKNTKPGPRKLAVLLKYQACNDLACYPPSEAKTQVTTKVTPAGEKAKLINKDLFPKSSPGPATQTGGFAGKLLGALAGSSPLLAALISFLLGLTLNLTPCVYPMIPITIGFFAGQAEGRKKKVLWLALAYVLGMAVTYSALGIASASFGTLMGRAFQNPIVIGAMVAVFVALALSMFGLYEMKLPAFIMNRTGAKNGVAGALLMGLMVGLVASPCVGPAVVGVAVWVTRLQNPILGFWIFFSMSLGFGIPMLLLAMFSGAINRLPQAGSWMATIKSLSGLALLGVAAYFAKFLLPGPMQRFAVPAFLLVAAVYLAMFEPSLRSLRSNRLARPSLGLAVGLIGLWFMAPHTRPSVNWTPYTPSALEQALKSNRPIMIDFTAAWCIPCEEMEKKTFTDRKVIAGSRRFVRLRVDLTKSSKPTDSLRKHYNVDGPPTVIFIGSGGQEIKDNRVIGFMPAGEFLKRML
ncbi:MAG: cytochrome c biogenesis protein CcdA [Armatimonadota bacterium]|nr:cytochrome c biogenesis protein CcdA [Armatimonadota bacterium]